MQWDRGVKPTSVPDQGQHAQPRVAERGPAVTQGPFPVSPGPGEPVLVQHVNLHHDTGSGCA